MAIGMSYRRFLTGNLLTGSSLSGSCQKEREGASGCLQRPVTNHLASDKAKSTTAKASTNDWVVEEKAIALSYNGISHAVMMATPTDLEDFAVGFSLTEGIINKTSDIFDIQLQQLEQGIELAISISSGQFAQLKQARRALAGVSGCGLCGKDFTRTGDTTAQERCRLYSDS